MKSQRLICARNRNFVMIILLYISFSNAELINGDFELAVCTKAECPLTSLAGWTSSSGTFDVFTSLSAFSPQSGSKAITLNSATGPYTISQKVSGLQNNVRYNISFWVGNPDPGCQNSALKSGNMEWQDPAGPMQLAFNATSKWTQLKLPTTGGNFAQELKFTSTTPGNGCGPWIDNVQIIQADGSNGDGQGNGTTPNGNGNGGDTRNQGDNQTVQNSTSNVGIIIGATIGSTLFLVAIVLGVIWYRKRTTKKTFVAKNFDSTIRPPSSSPPQILASNQDNQSIVLPRNDQLAMPIIRIEMNEEPHSKQLEAFLEAQESRPPEYSTLDI